MSHSVHFLLFIHLISLSFPPLCSSFFIDLFSLVPEVQVYVHQWALISCVNSRETLEGVPQRCLLTMNGVAGANPSAPSICAALSPF